MTYSLKVDWTFNQIIMIERALRRTGSSVPSQSRALLIDKLGLPDLLDLPDDAIMRHGATIKADLTSALLHCLETVLAEAVNQVPNEFRRALAEVRGYREATAAAKQLIESEDQN